MFHKPEIFVDNIMILTTLLQLDFRVLHLHNLKSLPTTSLYTTHAHQNFHCNRKT